MYHLILFSELAFAASAGFAMLYFNWKKFSPKNTVEVSPVYRRKNLLRLQKRYGYNAHSLVSISEKTEIWFDYKTQSGLSFTDCGKIRLVAGDMFAADDELQTALIKFLDETRTANKKIAFLPATEKFARAVVPLGFEAIKIGASPYFDLQNWNPRGDKAKKMRSGVNQAKHAGIRIEQISKIDGNLFFEVRALSESWLKTRPSATTFGWLLELEPFRHSDCKKYFTARDAAGNLVGFLAASPIPAREGWYLEDILRYADSPRGTADFLVYETLNILKSEGAKLATLGTVPLAADGADIFFNDQNSITKKIMNFSRENLGSFYNFKGLRHFKAKFVPSWWESEYVLIPKSFMAKPRVAKAFANAILPDGLLNAIFRKAD
jgi:phosphatidylglycerol lysyltransferase